MITRFDGSRKMSWDIERTFRERGLPIDEKGMGAQPNLH